MITFAVAKNNVVAVLEPLDSDEEKDVDAVMNDIATGKSKSWCG